MNAAKPVAFAPEKEIRLAVVIYGGVSLAIYINGIVQEMLRFVRATAPNAAGTESLIATDDLVASEKVYRKLGQILNDPGGIKPFDCLAALDTRTAPIRTCFIIDILSGTSAGGINAVFLGKALTNNQSLDNLEQLWIDEGDIEKLLNDKLSIETPLVAQKPPQSLLNSNRMYLKLLQALDGMEPPGPVARCPLVGELDLFSTATDIRGLTLPITLADNVVFERRHKNFFHFEFNQGTVPQRMDFSSDCNPFLAFAARATSAFPVAFEPMQLSDIFPVVGAQRLHEEKPYRDPDTRHWSRFYPDYEPKRAALWGQPFHFRAFGDGGYLDNKPFSYAIDTTLVRHSDYPVERKLVYIEPNPEELGAQPTGQARPDAVENSLAALLVLPRYETIREDLERIVNRNLQIERLERITRYVLRKDDGLWTQWDVPTWQAKPESWYDANPKDHGPGYAVYERLKLTSVTEELADLFSRIYGVDTRGAYGKAVQMLAGEWRDLDYKELEDQRKFLLKFDVQYRLRRIRYVRRRITDEYAEPHISPNLFGAQIDEFRRAYRKTLQEIKAAMREPYVRLRRLLEDPTVSDAQSNLTIKGRPIPGVVFTPGQMSLVAEPPDVPLEPTLTSNYPHFCERSDRGARARARFVLVEQNTAAAVRLLAAELARYFEPELIKSSDLIRESLKDPLDGTAASAVAEMAGQKARAFVRTEYDNFELYDSAAFPITFNTDVDDNGPISIHRISPEDAIARRDDVLRGNPKLRGQEFGSFGGFLDRTWRINDIIWGKLDGAERLISMVLPGEDANTAALRKQLIDEAHEEIVCSDRNLRFPDTHDWKRALGKFVAEVSTQPQPRVVAGSATRGTTVMGEMLEGLSDSYAAAAKPLFSRTALFGRIGWGIVEVSVPRTTGELFGNYWMQLILFFAAALLVIAVIASNSTLPLAVGVAVVAVMLWIVRGVVRRYLRGATILTPAGIAAFMFAVVTIVTTLMVYLYNASWIALLSSVWQAIAHQRPVLPGFLLDPLRRASTLQWAVSFLATSAAATVGSFIWLGIAVHAVKDLSPGRNVVRVLKSAAKWADIAGALGLLDATRTAIIARPAVVRAGNIVAAARRALKIDFAFAVAYGHLFIAIGIFVICKHDLAPDVYALGGILSASLGVVAAVANIRSNERALRTIGLPLPEILDAPIMAAPRACTLIKWIAVALAAVIAVAALFATSVK